MITIIALMIKSFFFHNDDIDEIIINCSIFETTIFMNHDKTKEIAKYLKIDENA